MKALSTHSRFDWVPASRKPSYIFEQKPLAKEKRNMVTMGIFEKLMKEIVGRRNLFAVILLAVAC
jgi:hypothetical protein